MSGRSVQRMFKELGGFDERLLQQVLQSPKCSLQRTSLKLGMSDRSVQRMFKELGGFDERLLQQVLQSPKCSLRRTLLKLDVSDRSVRQIFKELGRFAHHIQVAQRLTETDEWARLYYSIAAECCP